MDGIETSDIEFAAEPETSAAVNQSIMNVLWPATPPPVVNARLVIGIGINESITPPRGRARPQVAAALSAARKDG